MLHGFVVNQRIERLESKIVEHDQKFDLLLKITQQQQDMLQHEIKQAKTHIEAILITYYNDINEATRMQLELTNQALAELQAQKQRPASPRRRIGYKVSGEDELFKHCNPICDKGGMAVKV